jgi:sulfatase modifying factor 1
MRCCLLVLTLLASCALALGAEVPTLTSHLGHTGPAFAPGLLPSALGWGPDDRPYPDKFAVNPADLAELAWIPPGLFLMGTPPELRDPAHPERHTDELPVHPVRITRGFWMYRHEVTNEQFRRFRPQHNSGGYRGLLVNADKLPAVSLDWEAAKAYCDWAGVRLPTEAEWEYACRAGYSHRYTWGDDASVAGHFANFADKTAGAKWEDFSCFDTDDGIAVSAAVGLFPPNAWGLYDMLGNAWEWCADWWAPDYYAQSPVEDPPGPPTGQYRSLRGGSWFTGPEQGTCTDRFKYYPEDTCPGRGFRACVR